MPTKPNPCATPGAERRRILDLMENAVKTHQLKVRAERVEDLFDILRSLYPEIDQTLRQIEMVAENPEVIDDPEWAEICKPDKLREYLEASYTPAPPSKVLPEPEF